MRHFSLILAVALCAATPALANCPPPAQAVHSAQEAGALAARAVQACQLTSLPSACLRYHSSTEDKGSSFMVDVYEWHDSKCGGDPDTAPRLFSLRVTRQGKLSSDANSADGRYLPLKKAIG